MSATSVNQGAVMSMVDDGMQSGTSAGSSGRPGYDEPRGAGWVLFAGIMLMLVGILNAIYGIAAISNSSFFVNDTKYILSDLNTWGWVMLILGGLQLIAAYSVWNGNRFGVWFGIAVAGLNSIGALMSIPSYPFWSLSVFAVDILVIYGLAAYGGQRRPL
jgi:hypothetical protein